MTSPPKLDMTLYETHVYIEKVEGITISLQTVYNWANRGRRGKLLRTKHKAGMLHSTQRWVREFLEGNGRDRTENL